MSRPARIGAEAALAKLPQWSRAEGAREAIFRSFKFAFQKPTGYVSLRQRIPWTWILAAHG